MEETRDAKLQVQRIEQGDITYLKLEGTIDETFDGKSLSKGLKSNLIVSLANIRRITSFGIRNWVTFVTQVSSICPNIYYVECSPRIVDQFNMVSNFGGRGLIFSFYAPFRCETCSSEHLKLFTLDTDYEAIHSFQLEGGTCPSDKGQLFFDDDPEAYLSYLSIQPRFELEPDVAGFLAKRTQTPVSDGMRKIKISKKIHDRYTFIYLSGDIGDDLPIPKIADGLEGNIVFDLARVGLVSENGFHLWSQLMSTIAPYTERVLIVRLPMSMAERFSAEKVLGAKGQVLSVFLPFVCKTCGIASPQEVNVIKHYDVLKLATAPDLKCKTCNKHMVSKAPEEMLKALTAMPQPAPDLKKENVADLAAKQAATQAAPSLPLPLPGDAARAKTESQRMSMMMLVSILALIMGVGAVGFFIFQNWRGGSEVSAAMSAVTIETSDKTPPKWREKSFYKEGGQYYIVGKSGFAVDKQEGYTLAKTAALDELCYQVASAIKDPAWSEQVASQFQDMRSKGYDDLKKAIVSGDHDAILSHYRLLGQKHKAVAEAFAAMAAAMTQPEQVKTYWEKQKTPQGIRFQVTSLFQLSDKRFESLVKYFSSREEALLTKVVPYFPSLSWHNEINHGAVIIGLKEKSPLRLMGLQLGDIILAVQDRSINDAKSFGRIVTEEKNRIKSTGGTLLFKVQRKSGSLMEFQMTVKQPVRAVHRARRGRNMGARQQSDERRLPAANIWDDNPFE